MNSINYLNFGKKLFNLVNEANTKQTACFKNGFGQIKLDAQDILELTKNSKNTAFEKRICKNCTPDLKDWTMDLKYKANKKFKILALDLKYKNNTALKGAISQTDKNIIKYHFTHNATVLQTGNTFNSGILRTQSMKRMTVLPEKYMGSLWRLKDKKLLFMSDIVGLAGKRLELSELRKKYGFGTIKINYLKNYMLKKLEGFSGQENLQLFKTEGNNYTAVDYIKALKRSKESAAYEYLNNITDASYRDLVIDDAFLEEVKEARQLHKIIREWREAVNQKKMKLQQINQSNNL